MSEPSPHTLSPLILMLPLAIIFIAVVVCEWLTDGRDSNTGLETWQSGAFPAPDRRWNINPAQPVSEAAAPSDPSARAYIGATIAW